MVDLSFNLAPENCARLHDALTCLAKFSDSVSLDARPTQLTISALNASKSAYASITFAKDVFFDDFSLVGENRSSQSRFSCRLPNRALLSAFKSRLADAKGRETAMERCNVTVRDADDETECRFVVKMLCRHGVSKTFRLTYEVDESMHALFDKDRATNQWKIQSRLLREYIEYFGPKTEQLDIYCEEGRVTLTSYTEKVMNGKEVLKQPLQSAVAVDVQDFEEFNVQDELHVGISVKDFKHVVLHSDTLRAVITALYSVPSRPLQFSYEAFGIRCAFTLMTIGGTGASITPSVSRTATREPSALRASKERQEMPPPPPPVSRSLARPAQGNVNIARPTAQANNSFQDPDPTSLFIPDDDRRWDPAEDEGLEDTLGWNANLAQDNSSWGTFRNSEPLRSRGNGATAAAEDTSVIAPTQRASQVQGMFD